MPTLQQELVAAAIEEREIVAGRKETNPKMHETLVKYWSQGPQEFTGSEKHKNGLIASANREINKKTAWSAAFISYIMRKALSSSGSTADFDFSASHSVYAGAAIRNGLVNAASPAFIGYPPTGAGSIQPEVGDLVGVTRVKWVDDFADALDAARKKESYYSHFDVVTDITGDILSKIGGNVSNSVSLTTVKLDNGFLPNQPFKYDKAGRIVSGPFICVIKMR